MSFRKNSGSIHIINRKIGFFISAILAIVAVVSVPVTAGAADNAQVKNRTVRLYMKKYEKNNVVFYSGNSLARTTSVSAESYFKGSPYVCTPSGFGRTSHCYTRSAF
jgi:hypothetical protein